MNLIKPVSQLHIAKKRLKKAEEKLAMSEKKYLHILSMELKKQRPNYGDDFENLQKCSIEEEDSDLKLALAEDVAKNFREKKQKEIQLKKIEEKILKN